MQLWISKLFQRKWVGLNNSDKIVKEAQRLGFERIVLPIKNAERAGSRASALDVSNIEIIGLRNIAEAKKLF